MNPSEVRAHAEELAQIFKQDDNYYKLILGDLSSWNGVGELDSLLLPLDQGGCGLVSVFHMYNGEIDHILAPEYMTVLEQNVVEVNKVTGYTVSDHNLHYATLTV
ncbi:hypothetical protein [Romboutsia sp.]|uniref:hypothetical protein n=1 Tax=Romboutsia sp. TaxID=1965302 RepID=UPI003F3433F7